MKKLFLFACAITLAACSQQDELVQKEEPPVVDLEQLMEGKIEKGIINLESSDAAKVANLFFRSENETGMSTRASVSAPVVTTIYDDDETTPLLYVVNKGEGNGFAIISATKKLPPVLAFSDTNGFNTEQSNEYLEAYKESVRFALQDTSDSLRIKNALKWAVFEKTELLNMATRALSPTEQMINAEIARKEALGYTYIGKLTMLPYFMDSNRAQGITNDIASHSSQNYDYMDVSLFFLKQQTNLQVGTLLQTEWHQEAPFNVYAPNGLAGCGPIAVAQIAYYYKYPTYYDWDQIGVNPTSTPAFNNFITDIRDLCNVIYTSYLGTGCTTEDLKSAYQSLGYTVQEGGAVTTAGLKSELIARRPVHINGFDSDRIYTGHYWVCDGWREQRWRGTISYIPWDGITDDPNSPYNDYPLIIDVPGYSNSTTDEYYHMNYALRSPSQPTNPSNGWYDITTPGTAPLSYLEDQTFFRVSR